MGKEKEKITKAAIQYDGNVYTGWRHVQIGWKMLADGVCQTPLPGGEAQGFVTSTGRFVSREEAMEIALLAKQLNSVNKKMLFSEMVWDVNGKPRKLLRKSKKS